MKKTLLLLALIVWTGMQAVMAQSSVVSGTVLDENGQPLPAVSVKVKGTESGTITAMDGTFQVSIPEGVTPELIINAIGYAEKDITIDNPGQPVTVNMQVSNTVMDQVMVVAYGETTKEKFVGAADQITAKELEKFPVTNITKALQGLTTGLQVTDDGTPGGGVTMRLRGIGSFSASSAPLVVLDGAPYAGDVSTINPMDIQSTTVLKDATATALYGSRGANGVILITTKQGKRGADKPKLTVSAKVGIVQQGLPRYNVITSEKDYYEIAWEAYRNSLLVSLGYYEEGANKDLIMEQANLTASGKLPSFGPGIVEMLGNYNSYDVPNDQLIDPVTGKLNPDATLKYHDDWEDELTRTGVHQEYGLSLSGGSDKTDYYFSAGYTKEDGYVKYTDYERFTTRLNVNTAVTDWLKTGINLSLSYSTQNFGGSSIANGDLAGGYNPFYSARTFAPIYPVYYYDSTGHKEIDPLTGEYKYDWGDTTKYPNSSIGNRASLSNANVLGSLALDESRRNRLNIVAIPYIEATFLKYFKFRTMLNTNLYGSYNTDYNNPFYGQYAEQGGYSQKYAQQYINYTWNQVLSYERNFGLHHLNVKLAHENYSYSSSYVSAARTGLALPGNSNIAGASTPYYSTSYDDVHHIESYLGIANYDYDGKYYFQASLRKDGSSRLAPATRWGKAPFWAVGASWVLSEEDFLKSVDWLDLLKIKASYGTSGNEDLNSYYAYQALYDLGYPNGSVAGGMIDGVGNDALTWETAKKFNVGLEAGIFNRVNLEFNYFVKVNADLLFNLPMWPSSGIPSRPANTLTMKNNGIELHINADAIRTSDFTWNVDLKLSHVTNLITKMPEGQDSILSGNYQFKAGHSIYDFYLAESTVNPATGEEEFYYIDSAGNRADTSNYGYAIAHGGRTYQGSSMPDLLGSIQNQFTYKGFDLSFLFTFGIGGKFYDRIYQDLMGPGTAGSNWSEDILNRWTPENTNTDVPRVELDNLVMGSASTRFLIDASYLNLRNVSLGYTFTGDWVKSMGLQTIRLYGMADNLFLLSKRKGMNPIGTISGNANYTYYPSKTYMIGVNLGL